MNKHFSNKQRVFSRKALGLAIAAALALPLGASRACGFNKPAMFNDAQHQFSDAQALTVTAVSTNVIDLGVDRNAGIGEPLCVLITVDVAADGTTGDETYKFDLQTDDNVGFASPEILSSRTVSALPEIPRAAAAAGFKLVLDVPNDLRCERFLRMNYTLGGTTPTITVTAQLLPRSMVQAEAVYPRGYTIS